MGFPDHPQEAENPLAKTCRCLLMIHQGAAPISDFAF